MSLNRATASVLSILLGLSSAYAQLTTTTAQSATAAPPVFQA